MNKNTDRVYNQKEKRMMDLLDVLKIKNINTFAQKLGYTSSSLLYKNLKELGVPLPPALCHRIVRVFPQVNLAYLQEQSEEIINENKNIQIEKSELFEKMEEGDFLTMVNHRIYLRLGETNKLLMEFMKKQEETNDLLKKFMEELSNQ